MYVPRSYVLISKFFRFSLVGGSALLIDFLILFLLIENHISDPISAKLFSLIVTIFYTWYFNRNFTFNNKYKLKFYQLFIYYLFMALGKLINYGVYVLIVLSFPQLNYGYIVASAAGSGVSSFHVSASRSRRGSF